MKHRIIFFYLLFTFPLFAQTSEENEKSDDWKLWYRFPAREWEEALPVGNGHMGGMVYGGIDREHIALNEETIWSFPFQQVELNSRKQILIQEQRKLILEGKYEEAKKLKWNKLEIPDDFEVIKEKPEGFVTGRSIYKPLADLYLHFGSTSSLPYDYKRELDIENAVARVTYKVDDVTFKREVIASYPDKAIVVRLTASKPGQISVSSKMTRRVDVKDDMYRYDAELGAKVESIKTPPAPMIEVLDDDHFSFSGKADPDGVSYVAHFKLINEGGKRVPIENGFKVENADAVTIFITAATDFNYEDPDKIARKQMKKASSYSYDELFQRHVTDYKALYDRVDIQLEKTRNSKMSTDRRVMAHQMGIKDPRVTPGTPRDNNLYALYFQYSRYLMIASSRKGTMPPALQGIWNNSLLPPWFGHYTTDINIEMNYWPAEVCNLSESHDVLLDFVFPHLDKCKRAAEIEYGTRGMVFNSMSPWGPRRGYQDWNGFAGWLAQHFWEHYAYTLDTNYLKTKAYPWIKEVALFHVDYAIEYPDSGYLVIGPEYSPENHFYYSDGEEKKKGHISMGTTMSRAIAWEVLDNAIKASEILDVDEDLRKEFIQTRDKLSPYKIGKHGQLQEWLMDYDEPHPGHRHLSHLYGLYPGNEITKKNSPEIFEAARKSIDRRLENNGGWTGWSRAWIICLAAHLQDGELAREQLELLFEQTTLYNLFDTHPRQGGNTTCFQIEGNMGATAGIAEMLMQSHESYIHLLPAKPDNWRKGHVTGLVARGAFEVDVYWDKSKLAKASIRSKQGGVCKLKYGDKLIEIKTEKGKEYSFDENLKLVK
ncbi:glycoside hydrolase family 95 protein [Carboxylicivirga sp. RSCT41]|uniref:glycoside hydrolase family 95 protein n=1 Tax=Carboxylicivirga agarovorans TaxID=3417570 RepID=UPI003D34BB66